MTLRDSEKLQAVLLLGELEHSEDKIIYQFVVGGIISVSVAILVGMIQGHLMVDVGIYFLVGFWELAAALYFFTKRHLIKTREKISEEVKELEGSK